jgi:hypothetical protein
MTVVSDENIPSTAHRASAHSAVPGRPGLRDRLTPAVRVRAFTVFVGVLAVALYLGVVRYLPTLPVPFTIPWPLAALAFYLGETNVVEVHFLRERHSFSLSELPGIVGLFFLPPQEYVLACMVGTSFALLSDGKQSAVKRAFNLAQFGLAAMVALTIFHLVATPATPPGPQEWLAAFLAAGATSAIEATLVATAISLSGGAPQFRQLPRMLSFSEMVAMANTSLATLAVMALWGDPRSIVLLAVPTAIVFVAYRAYMAEREKHERLELLVRVQSTAALRPRTRFGDRRAARPRPADVPGRAGRDPALPDATLDAALRSSSGGLTDRRPWSPSPFP